MDKFETALQDLDDLETLDSLIMTESNVSNNIEDETYKITKEIFSMDDSKTYINCLNEIRTKLIEVEEVRERNKQSCLEKI